MSNKKIVINRTDDQDNLLNICFNTAEKIYNLINDISEDNNYIEKYCTSQQAYDNPAIAVGNLINSKIGQDWDANTPITDLCRLAIIDFDNLCCDDKVMTIDRLFTLAGKDTKINQFNFTAYDNITDQFITYKIINENNYLTIELIKFDDEIPSHLPMRVEITLSKDRKFAMIKAIYNEIADEYEEYHFHCDAGFGLYLFGLDKASVEATKINNELVVFIEYLFEILQAKWQLLVNQYIPTVCNKLDDFEFDECDFCPKNCNGCIGSNCPTYCEDCPYEYSHDAYEEESEDDSEDSENEDDD